MTRFLLSLLAICAVAPSLSAQTTVFIVRHAEKGTDSEKDPDLSEAGHARAQRLAKILSDAGITAIYTSEFKRTRQTAAPLGEALHLKPEIVPAANATALVEKLKTGKGNALVVGHGNTIPDLLKTVGITD